MRLNHLKPTFVSLLLWLGGVSESDVVMQEVATLTDCKLRCVSNAACKGVEFAVDTATCRLLTGPDAWICRKNLFKFANL